MESVSQLPLVTAQAKHPVISTLSAIGSVISYKNTWLCSLEAQSLKFITSWHISRHEIKIRMQAANQCFYTENTSMLVQEIHSGNFATTHSGQAEHQMKHSLKPTLLYLPEFFYFVHSLFLKSHNSNNYLPAPAILLILGSCWPWQFMSLFPFPTAFTESPKGR